MCPNRLSARVAKSVESHPGATLDRGQPVLTHGGGGGKNGDVLIDPLLFFVGVLRNRRRYLVSMWLVIGGPHSSFVSPVCTPPSKSCQEHSGFIQKKAVLGCRGGSQHFSYRRVVGYQDGV